MTNLREHAGQLLNQGLDAQDEGDWASALAFYRRAAEVDPSYFGPAMNAGLIHKWRGEWPLALEAFGRALSLVPELHPERISIGWNLGIAATAMSDWPSAFEAWSALGFPVERAADGSPAMAVGTTKLRLPPTGDDDPGELVWTNRFDPVRARILSVPTPESGFRYDDVVLHDGEPIGKYMGRSVFPVLLRLVASELATWTVEVTDSSGGDMVEGFLRAAEREGLLDDVAVEDFTSSLGLVHRGASEEGEVDFHYLSPTAPERDPARPRSVAIAARRGGDVRRLLEAWACESPGRSYEEPLDPA